jgi:hypothetical protein
MVDYVYYGRGDRANVRLGDEQVRAIIEGRRRNRTDVVAELRRMADDDPITGNERQLGHLYLLAQPEAASEEIFLNLLARNDTMQVLQEMTREIARNRGSGTTGFEPDIDPGGLFGFYAARPSSRRARWLVRRLSSGVPVQ